MIAVLSLWREHRVRIALQLSSLSTMPTIVISTIPSPDGHGYAVFGKVIEGMEVVDKIASTMTARRDGMSDVPKETVTIESIRRK